MKATIWLRPKTPNACVNNIKLLHLQSFLCGANYYAHNVPVTYCNILPTYVLKSGQAGIQQMESASTL